MEKTLTRVGYKFIAKAIIIPFIFLVVMYAAFFSYQFLVPAYFPGYIKYAKIVKLSLNLGNIIGIYWLLRNVVNASKVWLLRWTTEKNHPLISMIYPVLVSSFKGVAFFIMLNMIILLLNFQAEIGEYLNKAIRIFLIFFIASIIYKIVICLERYVVDKYIDHSEDIQHSRKLRTQVVLLKRIIVFLIIIFSLISISMLFESIKNFGISLLTTAGILSAVAAFASQQSLARLFAGLQLAFTQPLRIGDTVVIDNEFGQVEEITLSFITIKLWDLRRLIVPTDYFTNKGLVNLSAESSELLGTVFLYTDYTLPIEIIRKEFINILEQSAYWNKKTSSLDITDLKHNAMELRCLVSADDSNQLWKLRCEIREKLISYIVNHYPQCLTKSRSLSLTPQLANSAE